MSAYELLTGVRSPLWHARTGRKGWLGNFTFSQCRAIFNRGTGAIRGTVSVMEEDVPLQGDEAWPEVDDAHTVWGTSIVMLRAEERVTAASFHLREFCDSARMRSV